MTGFPEIESELNRKRIIQEMESIRLEGEVLKSRTLFDKSLALLGKWMISSGEKLRKRHHSYQEAPAVKLAKKVA